MAQTPGYIVRHLTVNDGLSQNLVYCMLQDQNGFLWFGTPDGLNRYDGYEFKIFYYDPRNQAGIGDNSVRTLLGDNNGTIWIGTEQSGLNQYLPELGLFKNYGLPQQADPSKTFTVNALAPNGDKQLWVGTNQGLWVFDKKTLQWIPEAVPVNSAEPSLEIAALLTDQKNTLWIGSDQGLFHGTPGSGQFQRYINDPENPGSLYANYIYTLFEDSFGKIWIGTSRGLNTVDPVSGDMKRIHIRTEGSPVKITSIIETADHYLWLSTNRKGLFRYHPETQSQYHLPRSVKGSTGLSPSGFTDLLIDRDSLLWIASRGMGIDVFNLRQPFHYYPSIPGDPNSLSNPSVRAILLDEDSTLWVGGYGGLDAFPPGGGNAVHYRYQPGKIPSLPIPFVYALAKDKEGNLWIGTEGKGLARLDVKAQTITTVPLYDEIPDPTFEQFVFALFIDSKNNLWIGTDQGLFKRSKERQTRGRFQHYTPENSGLPGAVISCITEDPFGNLWVGTESSGLGILDKKTDRFRSIRHNPANPKSLSDNRILCFLPEKTGSMWIGLKGGGLNQLKYSDYNPQDPSQSSFRHFNKKDGLVNDVVYGILDDNQGNLWLSTNKGIIQLIPETNQFIKFPLIYGEQSPEFNRGAHHKGWNGQLFFGGIQGLNSFFPEEVNKHLTDPPLVITEIKVLDQLLVPGKTSSTGVTINRSPNFLSGLELTYRTLSMTIKFSVLSFLDPSANRYRYRLNGILDTWLEIPATQRTVTLTHLPPGKYALEIQGANALGSWSNNSKILTLSVQAAPWKTWWAYIFYGTVLIFGIIGVIQYRLSYSRKRTIELEQEVTKRTEELRLREESLKNQNLFLESILESLSYPFYVVDAQTYRLVMANSAARAWGESEANTCYALKPGQKEPCGGATCPLRDLDNFREHRVKREVIRNPQGEEQHIEIHSHPIFTTTGEIKQIIEYYLDISDRIKLEISLQRNLEERNRELTTQALKMARSREAILNALKKLQPLASQITGEASLLLRGVESSLRELISKENEWEEFDTWFREVHKSFYDRLTQRIPDLTTRERKICAFLKLNMNTKEIASLTNLSVKSIEVYRSQLRKRLGIPTGENLVQFINNL